MHHCTALTIQHYTTPPTPCLHNCSLRWHAKSFYIYGCSPEQIPAGSGLSCNGASGVTVTFKKRGGIENSWSLAKQVATKNVWMESTKYIAAEGFPAYECVISTRCNDVLCNWPGKAKSNAWLVIVTCFLKIFLKRYIYINNIISWFERLGSGSELELSLAADQLGLQQSMFWGKNVEQCQVAILRGWFFEPVMNIAGDCTCTVMAWCLDTFKAAGPTPALKTTLMNSDRIDTTEETQASLANHIS